MAALDFPDSPTVGQVFDKWTWNGTMWVLTPGGAAGYVFVQDTTPVARKVGDTWFDTSTGATGGTSWVAIEEGAVGSEKVWVQTSPGVGTPPSPAIGYVAQTSTGALQTVGTGGTLLTGLSITMTAVAGAIYSVYGIINFRQRASTGLARMAILSSSPVSTIGGARMSLLADDYATLEAWSLVQQPPAGPVTYNLQAFTSGGTMDISGVDGCLNAIAVYRVA